MAKSIVIIDGHPDANSLNAAFTNTYYKEATKRDANVEKIIVRELNFNPNLAHGYNQRTEWEADLEKAWGLIKNADHLVFIHPVWWGGLPAVLKGFIDRVFLPGFVFKYREDSIWWDKLLTGKTARIICTLDQPFWYYRWFNNMPGIHQLKKMTLEFCGVRPVKVTGFGPVRKSTDAQRNKMLEVVERAARQDS